MTRNKVARAAAACRSQSENSLFARYVPLGPQGLGAYGTVWRAQDKETSEIVAMKCMTSEGRGLTEGIPPHVVREISLLRDFEHPNVVRLLSVHVASVAEFTIIFEYIEQDLHMVLHSYRDTHQVMPMELVTKYSHDIMKGLRACHVRRIMHRDLKPQNLLVAPRGLKICDFGLARLCASPKDTYTQNVATLWYRAPEILLGLETYGCAVDMWSAGCVVVEMATCRPLFPGESEIGTLFKIFKLLGTPTTETWPDVKLLKHWKITFPMWAPTHLEGILSQRPELGETGMDLINELLKMPPKLRMHSRRAATHQFFQQAATEPNESV